MEPSSELDLEEDETDELAAARAFADAKEYTRASHFLRTCKSAKGVFMHIYFRFLVSYTDHWKWTRPIAVAARHLRRKHCETGITWIVCILHVLPLSHKLTLPIPPRSTAQWATRHIRRLTQSNIPAAKNPNQPPHPVNAQLQEMLQPLSNATDPWLLFMYVLPHSSHYTMSPNCAILGRPSFSNDCKDEMKRLRQV